MAPRDMCLELLEGWGCYQADPGIQPHCKELSGQPPLVGLRASCPEMGDRLRDSPQDLGVCVHVCVCDTQSFETTA